MGACKDFTIHQFKSDMKLYFCDFHQGFDSSNNIFINSLRHIYSEEIRLVDSSEHADIIFTSIFGAEHIKVINRYKYKAILWLGENIRARKYSPKYSISTDFSTDSNHFRLPLWYLEIDWHTTGLGVCSVSEMISKLYR